MAAAKTTKERWDEERRASDKEARRRKRLGIPAEGYDGQFEAKATTVRSPTQSAESLGVQTEQVLRNTKHDVLEYEFACKRIDEAQKVAGDRFLALIQRAGIGGARAIDYEAPKVDGGGKADTLSDAVADAHKRLKAIRGELKGDYDLLVMAIGDGKTLKEIARAWYSDSPRYRPNPHHAKIYIAQRFRDALDRLTGVLGVARGKADQELRTWKDDPPLHFGEMGT